MSLPAQIARTRRFTLGVPGQFTVPTKRMLFLRTRAGDDPVGCLWALAHAHRRQSGGRSR